jgi:hypothetical protein
MPEAELDRFSSSYHLLSPKEESCRLETYGNSEFPRFRSALPWKTYAFSAPGPGDSCGKTAHGVHYGDRLASRSGDKRTVSLLRYSSTVRRRGLHRALPRFEV